jgi:hypothetical protein
MHRQLYISSVIINILFLITFQLHAQVEENTLYKKFDLHRKNNLQEKLYLKTDRATYLVGETMWFSVVLVDGTFHRPLDLSKIGYIELVNQQNQAILQTKVELKEGRGEGALYLPSSILSGNYQVRAYTNWMKNYDPSFFYHQTISVYNTFSNEKVDEGQTSNTIHASFLPEGGNLIEDVPSIIAFHITNDDGVGLNYPGFLINQFNDTIVQFKPEQFGLGRFLFTPQHGMNYTAYVVEPSGKLQRFKLSDISPSGFSIRLSERDNSIDLTIHGKQIDNPNFSVIAHTRNHVVFSNASHLTNGTQSISIEKNSIPDGILHITVFDGNQRPVCERLYFKKPSNILQINATTQSQKYLPRRKVELDITTLQNQQLSSADLIVSVFKNDSINRTNENIIQYLLLTSDLVGEIESVESYFKHNANPIAIDNLMLVHGWRRFTWKEINDATIANTTKNYIPEYRGHIIHGIVKDATGKSAEGIRTYLSSPEKSIRLYGAISDKDGKVMYEMQNFYGNTGIIAQMNPKLDSTYQIQIVSPYVEQFGKIKLPRFIFPINNSKEILERSIAMQVQDIYYREETEKLKDTYRDTTSFYYKGDNIYYLDNYTRFPVMEEVFREYVPGVSVRKRKDGYHLLVLDDIHGTVFQSGSLMLLDGIPMFDANEILAIDPLKIKRLEVIRREYFLGLYRFPGIISLSTYNNDLAGIELHPRSHKINYEGLQLQREFYSPSHAGQKQRERKLPDQRTLLYWNPQVITNENGNIKIEFYTSDVPGAYTIVIEGITKDGTPGYTTSTFEVKE